MWIYLLLLINKTYIYLRIMKVKNLRDI